MKLIDISRKIDKSKKNTEHIDITEIAREFNIVINNDVDQDRLQSYWIANWMCADTWVGCQMYFLDDEPVGISVQMNRKSDKEFKWFSKEHAFKVRDYILRLIIENNIGISLSLCDINQDIGDSYKIRFYDNIVNLDKAKFNNEPVKILERIREPYDFGLDQRLKIQLLNGEIKEVDVHQLDFSFNLMCE